MSTVRRRWHDLKRFSKSINLEDERKTGSITIDDVTYRLANRVSSRPGWFQVGGKWYYAYSSGALAVSTTVNGYTVNANGEWV